MELSDSVSIAINVTAESLGCLIILILIASVFINGDTRTRQGRMFLLVLLCSLPQIGGDALTWLFDQHPGQLARTICQIGNYIAFFGVSGAVMSYLLYIRESVGRNTKASSAIVGITAAMTVAYLALVIANPFTGMLYSISAGNVFSYGPWYIVAVGYVILSGLLKILLVLCHWDDFSAKNALVISAYAYIPAVSALAHLSGINIMFANIGFILSLIIVYTGYQSQERQRVQMELQDAKISTMLSQIQPHFLYNTLNTIGDLCVTDPAQAQETVFEFSDYLRANMDSLSMSTSLIPFEKERRHVETYLSLEQKRFEDRLRVVYDIQASDFSLPPLTIQPIAENAVLHGITARLEPGTLVIRTEETAQGIKITVADDGEGFDPSLPTEVGKSHVGVENVRKRVETVCGGGLTVESAPGKGTTVTILIPQRRDTE